MLRPSTPITVFTLTLTEQMTARMHITDKAWQAHRYLCWRTGGVLGRVLGDATRTETGYSMQVIPTPAYYDSLKEMATATHYFNPRTGEEIPLEQIHFIN